MKVSLNWLTEYFPDIANKNYLFDKQKEILKSLPKVGLEVGGVSNPGEKIKGVVVGEIKSFSKHPDADKLNICQVNTGKEVLQIICGASNVQNNLKVAVAQIGVNLPGDFKIKKAKIRGVESFGMLCSIDELGIGDGKSEGILELSSDAVVGDELSDHLKLSDVCLDIELTPDRGDCLSHLGIAREIGAIIHENIKIPEFDILKKDDNSGVPLISVDVQELDACPIYSAQVFAIDSSLKSPNWLVSKLTSIGLANHSPAVDITNFVMTDLGQPMHAFDADKIAGSKIIVRFAKQDEEFISLEEKTYKLSPSDLVIADTEKVLALAGVMGGLSSSVSADTKTIVLEVAVFDSILVRQTSLKYKIHTDSSHRFERGVDALNYSRAAGRATKLFREIANARPRGAFVEVKSKKAKELQSTRSLNLDLRRLRDVLGIEPSVQHLVRSFSSVGIVAREKTSNVLSVQIPTHRLDLVREIDLVEEAARLLGYDDIPIRFPVLRKKYHSQNKDIYTYIKSIKSQFNKIGLTEVMPYSFIGNKEKDFLIDPEHKLIEVEKPLSQEWQFLRPNISFGLLKVLTKHASLSQNDARIFDGGRVFSFKKIDTKEKYSIPCYESFNVGWAMMGRRSQDHWLVDKKSSDFKQNVDFYDSKGVLDNIVKYLSAFNSSWAGIKIELLSDVSDSECIKLGGGWIPKSLLHPTRSGLIFLPSGKQKKLVGYVGELNPKKINKLLNLSADLRLGACLGELRLIDDLSNINDPLGKKISSNKIKASLTNPVVERDLAMIIDKKIKAEQVKSILTKEAGKDLIDIQCVDYFVLPDDKVSVSYRFKLQNTEKTLTDEDLNKVMKNMINKCTAKLGASLRS